MIWLAALAFAIALSANALPADPITIESPEPDKYQVTLAVIDVEQARFINTYYEPVSGEEIPAGPGWALLEHRATIVRRLAGPPVKGFDRVRRLDTGYMWKEPAPVGRMIAVIEPTQDGYHYLQWSAALNGRFACFPRDIIDHFHIRFARPRKPDANGAICIDV